MALSKSKKEDAYYSFSKLLKFSISAYEHSINNIEVTNLKPTTLQGHTILDSIKQFKIATDISGFDAEVTKINTLIERLR